MIFRLALGLLMAIWRTFLFIAIVLLCAVLTFFLPFYWAFDIQHEISSTESERL